MSTIPAYPLGAPVTISTTFNDRAGTLTDATVALTVRAPDGSETPLTGSVVHDSTGTYHADYTPPASGEYYFRWVATGALTAANEGQFQVLRSEL